jgi:hypothetical protein
LRGDEELRTRMASIAAQVQVFPGTEKAAGLIERLAAERSPIMR